MAEVQPPKDRQVPLSPKPIDQADRSLGALRTLPEEALCPSCGRFVGAYEKCPYCGAELKKRMSLVVWKRISVVGALAGIFLMWLAATKMEPDLLQVGEITETHNNAVIRASGVVVDRTMDKAKGRIRLVLADASGSVSVMGFGVLPKLQALGNLPKVGDKIELVGQVQVSDQYGTSLFLNVPTRLKILEAPPPQEVKIGEINESYANTRVTVSGQVKFPARYGKAMITDGAGEITVLVDPANLGGEIPELKTGDGIRVTGVVSSSKGKFVITPGSLEELEFAEVEMVKVASRKISEITLEMQDQPVMIEGQAAGFRALPKGGGILTVSDGTGQLEVPLFAQTYEGIPGAEKLKVSGTRVRVRGTVGEYRGKPQVKPGSASDVTILLPSAPADDSR